MKKVGKETLYFETGPDNAPTVFVDPDEEFEVETQLNAGPWLDTHPDGAKMRARLRGGNPSSGCIAVRGARPGDMLAVHVGEITLAPVGFTEFSGTSGAVPGLFGPSALGRQGRVVRIEGSHVLWSEKLRIPVRPMLGFVGVAPARERHHNGWGGYWGGNMDVQEVTTGATVYLPVQAPDALLHVGDMHAIQGDGEICGAGGIEAEGTVRMRCTLHPKPARMGYPRIENGSHIITMAMARPAEDAFRQALERLVEWLEDGAPGAQPMARGEAFLLLAQVLEARCTQFVNPTFTYVTKIDRRYLSS